MGYMNANLGVTNYNRFISYKKGNKLVCIYRDFSGSEDIYYCPPQCGMHCYYGNEDAFSNTTQLLNILEHIKDINDEDV